MSLLNPNIEADFDRYMEKRSEFERNFKSRVVSVLIIDPKNEFPLKDLRFEGISTKYFDISDITEQDFRLMGKWITERINGRWFFIRWSDIRQCRCLYPHLKKRMRNTTWSKC